jgi:tetratricopeptide (TPR) repeat protein
VPDKKDQSSGAPPRGQVGPGSAADAGQGLRPADERLFTAEPMRSPSELEQARVKRESAVRLLESGGDARQAVKLLLEAVAIDPEPRGLTILAELELSNPLSRQRALDHLKQAVALDAKCTQAWLALANYWSLRSQPDKQARCLQKILSYEPNNPDVREALTLIAPGEAPKGH